MFGLRAASKKGITGETICRQGAHSAFSMTFSVHQMRFWMSFRMMTIWQTMLILKNIIGPGRVRARPNSSRARFRCWLGHHVTSRLHFRVLDGQRTCGFRSNLCLDIQPVNRLHLFSAVGTQCDICTRTMLSRMSFTQAFKFL